MRLLKILLCLLMLSLVLMGITIGFTKKSSENLTLQATGLNDHFIYSSALSFSDYVQASQIMLKRARAHAHVNITEKIITENAPLALFPKTPACKKNSNGKYENGILLVHGMLDSPYPMQELGKYFQAKCFVTYIILLPGHGTVPGDLLNVNYGDWIAATHFGATKLSEQVTHVYLGGYSLGGLLVIHEALLNPSLYKGLILFSPAMEIKSKLAVLTKPIYYLSFIIKPLQWWERYSESSDVRYESLAVNPIYQIQLLMGKVSAELKASPLKLPLFIEQSADDVTVNADSVLNLMKIDNNANSLMLWFTESNSLPFEDTRINVLSGAIPAEKILSLSHTSLILPASDPIYGMHGTYKSCLQYNENSNDWLRCKTGKDNYQGEITSFNLHHYIMQRITFNPFYEKMMQGLTIFLNNNA